MGRARLNDDGSTASDASKMPAADLTRVTTFLAGGMCTDALASHFIPLHEPAVESGGRLVAEAASLSDSCAQFFDAVPLAACAKFQLLPATPVLRLCAAACTAPVRMCTAGGFDFACAVASCSAGDDGEQHACLVRRRHAPSAPGGVSHEALLMRLAPGERVVDIQFYREARLVLLLRDAQGACRLEEFSCSQLPCIILSREDGDALSECEDRGAVVDASSLSDGVRRPMVVLPGIDAAPPLALGSKRGLACAFMDQTRGVLIDLEAAGDEED